MPLARPLNGASARQERKYRTPVDTLPITLRDLAIKIGYRFDTMLDAAESHVCFQRPILHVTVPFTQGILITFNPVASLL